MRLGDPIILSVGLIVVVMAALYVVVSHFRWQRRRGTPFGKCVAGAAIGFTGIVIPPFIIVWIFFPEPLRIAAGYTQRVSPSIDWRVFAFSVGILLVVTSGVTAVRTFFRFSEFAERERQRGRELRQLADRQAAPRELLGTMDWTPRLIFLAGVILIAIAVWRL